MTDTKLYKVAITPCGKYVHGTDYDALCLVLNATEDGGDGCSYISKKPNKNVRPGTDDSVWALSLERGQQGEQGPNGAGFSQVEISVSGDGDTPSGTASISNDTLHLNLGGMRGPTGQDGQNGQKGADGKSAYQSWLDAGNVGNEAAFLASLKGADGDGRSAYQAAVDGGYSGTEQEWIASLHGADGVGFQSISSQQDGTLLITLTDGNTITVDLNHNHPQYPKYMLLEHELEYEDIPVKDPETLYLIIDNGSAPQGGGSSV